MDDPEKVTAYTRAGRIDGVMAPVYLHHCIHICEVIRPGDVAVDLACGPATQLAQVARLNPDVRFIGVDLSEPMLERARAHVAELQLKNVEFRLGDISLLEGFSDSLGQRGFHDHGAASPPDLGSSQEHFIYAGFPHAHQQQL